MMKSRTQSHSLQMHPNMRKIIMTLLLLIFLTACSTAQQGRGSGTPDGLHILFIEFQPRSELKQDEYFDIGLKLENRAECQVEGEVCIRDTFAESISGVRNDCQSFELMEKDGGIIDTENIYFQDNVYTNPSADLKSTIIAKAMYSCSIQLTPQICVKPDLEDEKTCKIRETLSQSTLGLKQAPITVASIDKTLIPQKDGINLEVAIHLRKMNEGSPRDFNINVEYEGYGPLACRDADRLDFSTNTENIINCKIPTNVQDIEENPLRIILSYVYEITASKQIKIIKEGDN